MFRLLRRVEHGDWPSRLIGTAQIIVGTMAAVGIAAFVSLSPFLVVFLAFGQVFFVIGAVLFGIVVIFAQRIMVLERFSAGETIFREGEPGYHIYGIKSGKIDVFRTQPDGSERLIERLGTGDHIGDLALLGNGLPRRTTVRAATDAEVYRLNPDALTVLYSSLPEIREFLRERMEPHLAAFKARRYITRRSRGGEGHRGPANSEQDHP